MNCFFRTPSFMLNNLGQSGTEFKAGITSTAEKMAAAAFAAADKAVSPIPRLPTYSTVVGKRSWRFNGV